MILYLCYFGYEKKQGLGNTGLAYTGVPILFRVYTKLMLENTG